METYSQIALKDNVLTSNLPDANNGNDATEGLVDIPSQKYRTIISFDVSALNDREMIIDSAKLSLYYYSLAAGYSATGKQVDVFKLTPAGTWGETNSTWNKYDGINTWTLAGGDWVISPTGATAVMPALNNWIEFDVSAIVKDAITNNGGIVNFIIKFNNEAALVGNFSACVFYSRTGSPGDITLRPKLEVLYTNKWENKTKHTTSWADKAKNTTSWNDKIMNTTSWSDKTKNTTSWADKSKNTTSWTFKTKN